MSPTNSTSLSGDSLTPTNSLSPWDCSADASLSAHEDGDGRKHTKSRTLAPNLTRRSHKKSRAGCFSCKARKIKCGEQKPECGSCLLKGIPCVYPTETPARRSNLPLIKRNPPATPSFAGVTFSMVDMRFFHHFLTIAYPHLPVGNDHVWVHEIPQFAEQHEYLMHAILSLGASHLGRLTGIDYRRESLVHRGQALAGLNQALSQASRCYGESDAMLASCYALTFQASYMGDGLTDFITMVRGCALTTDKIQRELSPTAFNLQPDWHLKFMAPRLEHLPTVDPTLLEDAYLALEEISPLLSDDTHYNFHAGLVDVVSALQTSSASGYMQFTELYTIWYDLCHDSFKTFLDPNNLVAQLLLSYFVGVQLLIVPLATHEFMHRADVSRIRVLYGVTEWAESIFLRLENSEYAQFLSWPQNIISTVVAELNGGILQLPSVLQLHLTKRDITPNTILAPP
ncbi:uncharacterized protein PV06_10268 [Exophiala oligosperma]|uniref:Zn(2)-C6 fungal-type domain-containing protein n=1 Tax=Exophiala oligosperma TaxID=215243 RepID=A0A0D2BJP8_9EURO|nr:uncharacterized protein PV06_10268 [Exophiala oligosperma]KIW37627.1 hypothetical protein PV06_10268 [Exophiala oligosperma]